MMNRLTLSAAAIIVTASAHAQLVIGSTYFASANPTQSGAHYIDVNTGASTQLWSGTGSRKVNGIAASDATSKMYANDSARLLVWNYGSVGTQPTMINGLYRTGHDGLTYATGVDDLTLTNGQLYGYTTFNVASGGATNVDDGIYRIDTTNTTSGTPNMSLVWMHADQAYNFQGIAFDAASGLFFGANQTGATNAAGIYTIDVLGSGAVTSYLALPSDITSADGITIGGGRLWISQKISTNAFVLIRGYNLATSTWDKTLTFGTSFPNANNYATGLTWTNSNPVPEPVSICSLATGVLLLVKRRKRAQ